MTLQLENGRHLFSDGAMIKTNNISGFYEEHSNMGNRQKYKIPINRGKVTIVVKKKRDELGNFRKRCHRI